MVPLTWSWRRGSRGWSLKFAMALPTERTESILESMNRDLSSSIRDEWDNTKTVSAELLIGWDR